MRFTIRDVLLVMVIVGLAAGWWLDRRRLHAKQVDLYRRQLYWEHATYQMAMELADRGNGRLEYADFDGGTVVADANNPQPFKLSNPAVAP
jgi:hypothetical protein